MRTEDGVRLWAERLGRGAPVVCCHGGPGLWDMMGDVARTLPAAVHRWDQRGCGRSERRGPYTVARTIADLDAVRAHFGLATMTLLGHSWGAQLALRYALAHPGRVAGLIYVSGTGIDHPSMWHEDYERNLRRAIGTHLARWEALDSRTRTAAEDRELCVLQWSADFADRDGALAHAERMATLWYGVNFECHASLNAEDKRDWGSPRLREACAALQVPTLIVDGALDIRPRRAVDSLARVLPAVSRVTLAGAGHLPWVEDPTGFRAAVSSFLARADG